MLTLVNNLPDNVLGISAEGKLTGLDYETVLIPAVGEKLKTEKRIRLLYHLGKDFSGFELAAALDDAKIGMKHFFAWERAAFVSDHKIVNTLVKLFAYLIPCDIRIFADAELSKAKNWNSEPA